MKNSKIVAAMAAAALSVSMMAMIPASAEIACEADSKDLPLDMNAWGSQWVKSYDDTWKDEDVDMSNYVMKFTVETDAEYDDENNIVFKVYGVNGDNELGQTWEYEEGVTEYTFEYNLGDVEIDQWGGFGFNTQAGHFGVTLTAISIEEVASEDDKPSDDDVATDDETTADDDVTTGEETTTGDDDTTGDETTTEEEYTTGDINGDGEINVTDLMAVAAHVKQIRPLTKAGQKAADVNGDGELDVTDLMAIAAHVKSIRPLYKA